MAKRTGSFLIGLAEGLAKGYSAQKDKERDEARQDKFDKITLDEADERTKERARKEQIRTGIAGASKDLSIEELGSDQPVQIDKSNSQEIEKPQSTAIPLLSIDRQAPQARAPIAAQGVSPSSNPYDPGDTRTNPVPIAIAAQQPDQAQAQAAQSKRFKFNGAEFADRTLAEQAASAYNSPEAKAARIAQAYRNNGDPATALRLEQEFKQSQATDLTLKQAKESDARMQFGRGMVNSYFTGGADSLMGYLSNSHADGKQGAIKFAQELSPDGKFSTVFKTDENGKRMKVANVPNTEEGWQSAMFNLQKGLSPDQLFSHSAAMKKSELEERKVRATELKADSDSRRTDARERQTDALIAGVIGNRESSASSSNSQSPNAPTWNDKASSFLQDAYTKKDPMTGAVKQDGDGLAFSKTVALAISRKNGGDLDTALGRAIDADSVIVNKYTDKTGAVDYEAVRKERQQQLDKLNDVVPPHAKEATATPAPIASRGLIKESDRPIPKALQNDTVALKQVTDARAAKDRDAADKLAQKTQEAARKKTMASEIEGLTADDAINLSPEKAAEILTKYRGFLPNDVSNALRLRFTPERFARY